MNLRIKCNEAIISPLGYRDIEVEINGAETSEVLGEFDIKEIISTLGADALLDAIGKEAAANHFDLLDLG